MRGSPNTVIFDVDGVLLDSLPQHLQICRDKAAEFGLSLNIPTVAEFRRLVGRGVKVSPMLQFFIAVGFPVDLAQRADEDYREHFMSRYPPKPFDGITEMLAALKSSGLKIGLVTSNVRANVVPALGSAMKYFDQRGLFFFDSVKEARPKSWYLAECVRSLGSKPKESIYVGDQPADEAAARQAGTLFLGVTYGWGIAKGDHPYPTADSVAEISERLISQYVLT